MTSTTVEILAKIKACCKDINWPRPSKRKLASKLPGRKRIDPALRIKAGGSQGNLGSLGETQEVQVDRGAQVPRDPKTSIQMVTAHKAYKLL